MHLHGAAESTAWGVREGVLASFTGRGAPEGVALRLLWYIHGSAESVTLSISRTAMRSGVWELPPMPCYLFTYHAYGSWMHDRRQGYVQRKRGILPPDVALAQKYRAAMTQCEVKFTSDTQIAIIDCLLESREKQNFEL